MLSLHFGAFGFQFFATFDFWCLVIGTCDLLVCFFFFFRAHAFWCLVPIALLLGAFFLLVFFWCSCFLKFFWTIDFWCLVLVLFCVFFSLILFGVFFADAFWCLMLVLICIFVLMLFGVVFSCPADSSIGDLVTDSLSE